MKRIIGYLLFYFFNIGAYPVLYVMHFWDDKILKVYSKFFGDLMKRGLSKEDLEELGFVSQGVKWTLSHRGWFLSTSGVVSNGKVKVDMTRPGTSFHVEVRHVEDLRTFLRVL